jgi:hypothetical protein
VRVRMCACIVRVDDRVCVCVVHVDDRVCACCVRGREYLLLYVCSVSVADPSIRPTGRRGAEHEKKVL